MTPTTLLIVLYCVMIVVASLLGGLLPSMMRLNHLRMQIIMSLVSGLMLGVATIHMLPHAALAVPSFVPVAYSMLGGVVMMFFLLRIFHVHHHTDPDHSRCDHQHIDSIEHSAGSEHSHGDEHSHSHEHSHDDQPGTEGLTETPDAQSVSSESRIRLPSRFSWQGLFVGLAIHTLIDGVALAASVRSESGSGLPLLGLGTFLAIMLHKPLDAMSITSLMRTRGTSLENQMLVNCGFAMTCPIGALAAWNSMTVIGDAASQNLLLGCSLGFSAGFFLCIALGDLLPEVQFHSHDRGKLTLALIAGILLAIFIEVLHTH